MAISFDFDLITLLIIAAITVAQAIFGVGILLWGTPIFLLLGHDFIQTLILLLPLSLILSAMQFLPNTRRIDQHLFIKFFIYSLIGVVVGLNFIIIYDFDVNLLVAFILCSSIFFRLPKLSKIISDLKQKYDRILIFIIGLVHGLSNLGGPLLVLRISGEGLNKENYRALTAAVYFLFAASQLIILSFNVDYLELSLVYPIFVISTYIISNRYIFKNIAQRRFDNLINFLLLSMASLLFLKVIVL